jgi:hypothetical protein
VGEVGTLPFGWVRGEGSDNWQIIWDPKTKTVFAQGAMSKKVLRLGESSTWEDAKHFADTVMSDPGGYFSDPA